MNDNEYMRRVRAIEGRLFRVAQAILWREADSVDAVQEAVFKGWMKKDRLNDADRLEPWLTRILVNVCRDMLRRRKRDPVPLPEQVSREDSLCEDLQLRLALKALPEKYRPRPGCTRRERPFEPCWTEVTNNEEGQAAPFPGVHGSPLPTGRRR